MTDYVTEDQRRRDAVERQRAANAARRRYVEIDPVEARWMRDRGDGTREITEVGFESGIVRNVPAWHEKALVQATDVEGELTPEVVFDKVPELASNVIKEPVMFDGQPMPGKFFTVREYDRKALGIVGNRYEVVQNHEAFDVLGQLCDTNEIVIESAITYNEGRSVAFQARRPEGVLIAGEETTPFLLWTNNHDGTGQIETRATPERGVCKNTVRIAINGAPNSYKVRHTRNASIKLAEAREAIGITFKYVDVLKELGEDMALTPISDNQFTAFLNSLVPVPEELTSTTEDGKIRVTNKRAITNAENLREGIRDVYMTADNLGNIKGTAWGTVQAVLEHEEHHRKYKSADRRIETILGVPTLSQRAFDMALELSRPTPGPTIHVG